MISILPRIAAPAQVNINGREPSLEEIEIDEQLEIADLSDEEYF